MLITAMEKILLDSMKSGEIWYCEGEIEEFIAAAQKLGWDFDYCQTAEGIDFMAWNPEAPQRAAQIKL